MKTYVLLLLLLTSCGVSAQPRTGQQVADFSIGPLLNAPTPATTLHAQWGKLVLLEFWATWCGPCLEAMPHLQALQKRHAEQLQVITVTQETPGRIRQFLRARPSTLWFATDTAGAVARLFPHHIIPHTVLIGPDGTLLGQTTPQAVTDGLIDSLWHRQAGQVVAKVDNPMTVHQILTTLFAATDTVTNRFMVQAQLPGAPSMSTTHLADSAFHHRRLTGINLPLTSLYRLAYGNYSYKRVLDQTGYPDAGPLYCLDLIVDQPDRLLPALRAELARRFEVQARLEARTKDVLALQIVDMAKFKALTRNPTGARRFTARRGQIEQQAATLADLADLLENYGGSKRIVVDETQNAEKLDIQLIYQPEDAQSLPSALAAMGLRLLPAQRPVELLVLYK